MADNVTLNKASGTFDAATDDLGAAGHVQWVKLRDGTDGGTDTIPGSAARGLAVDPRLNIVRVSVSPTVSTTPAYTAKDAVGGLLTFANVARASGGSVRIDSVMLVDVSQQQKDLDLILFDRSITAPTDNAVFDPTDAELANVVGVVPIYAGHYADFNDNSVASVVPLGLTAVLNGTSLFGVLVARGTPTYVATTDLTVIITATRLD